MQRNHIRNIVVCTFLCLAIGAAASADGASYTVGMDREDVLIEESNGYIRLSVANGFTAAAVGHPNLPALALTYVVPIGKRAVDVSVLDASSVVIYSDAKPEPVQQPVRSDADIAWTDPDQGAYEASSFSIENALMIANQGTLRGVNLVTIWFRPLHYNSRTDEILLVNEIEFSLEFVDIESPAISPQKTLSPSLAEQLRKVVKNPEAVAGARERIDNMAASIPGPEAVIITNLDMASAFSAYADWKTKRGVPTVVKTVESISTQYSGDSLLLKIRAYIQDMYLTNSTEWVILGGDIDVIPQAYAYTALDNSEYFDGWISTDMYYSCLDHSWDQNNDGYFGRPEAYGDTVDFYPEVYVGRLPVNTLSEAQAVVNKLLAYEKDASIADYQTRALFSSTHFHNDDTHPLTEQFHNLSQSLQSELPAAFSKADRYEQPAAGLVSEMNYGYGIIANYSHSACGAECFLAIHGPGPCCREPVFYTDIDGLTNTGRYGFFLNSTCRNNELSWENGQSERVCVGRSFILNPSGGGIGYLGASVYNYSSIISPMHQDFFNAIFSQGEPRPGAAVAIAKVPLVPQTSWVENIQRVALFSYNLLGDPELKLWTSDPGMLEISSAPSSLTKGHRSFNVVVVENGIGVSNALVCLKKGSEVYERRYTDYSGVASFSSIYFPSTGTASIVASKHNYFPDETSMSITNPDPPPPSCPVLYSFNGTEYVQENPLLTACEQFGYRVPVTDYYHIAGDVSDNSGSVVFQLREMEDEVTYLDEITLITVDHSPSSNVACAVDGRIFTYQEEIVTPLAAIDQNGIDHLEEILEEDSVLFTSLVPGSLTLTFPNDESDGGFQFRVADKSICDIKEEIENPSASDEPSYLRAEVQLDDGSWVELPALPPRENLTQNLILSDLQRPSGDFIKIRFSWSDHYSTDLINRLVASNENPIIRSWNVGAFSVVDGVAAAKAWKGFSADGPLVLRKGDIFEFSFDADQPTEGLSRDYIVVAKGRYEPDFGVYSGLLPRDVRLYGNYPNPFNPSTEIAFSIPKPSWVRLEVFNVLGQKLTTLVDEMLSAGFHNAEWNVDDHTSVASGVYFYRLQVGDHVASKKMLLLK